MDLLSETKDVDDVYIKRDIDIWSIYQHYTCLQKVTSIKQEKKSIGNMSKKKSKKPKRYLGTVANVFVETILPWLGTLASFGEVDYSSQM